MAVRLEVRHRDGEGGESAEPLTFEFDQARVAIGRGRGADVRLPDLAISELHATLQVSGSRYVLCDERSTNGTRVGGAALIPGRPRGLESGDVVEVGPFVLRVSLGPVLTGVTSAERTASLARRLIREVSPRAEAREPMVLRVVRGPDNGTVLNVAPPPARIVIGRSEEAELCLRDRDVSREHLELERDLDGVIARDLASKNGLVVNGKRLRERRLRHGDVITLGGTDVLFEDPAEAALRALEGQADEPMTRTLPSAAASVEPVAMEPEEPEARPSAPAPTLPPDPNESTSADVLIYALAGTVLLASLIGLGWLFMS